jgi:hypothetical protein
VASEPFGQPPQSVSISSCKRWLSSARREA